MRARDVRTGVSKPNLSIAGKVHERDQLEGIALTPMVAFYTWLSAVCLVDLHTSL